MPASGSQPRMSGAHSLSLDEHLQRQRCGGIVTRARGGLRIERAWHEPPESCRFSTHSSLDRRAAVLCLQFPELPLPAEQPEGIGDARLQTGAQIGVGRERLESRPDGERWLRRQDTWQNRSLDNHGHEVFPRIEPAATAPASAVIFTEGTSRLELSGRYVVGSRMPSALS